MSSAPRLRLLQWLGYHHKMRFLYWCLLLVIQNSHMLIDQAITEFDCGRNPFFHLIFYLFNLFGPHLIRVEQNAHRPFSLFKSSVKTLQIVFFTCIQTLSQHSHSKISIDINNFRDFSINSARLLAPGRPGLWSLNVAVFKYLRLILFAITFIFGIRAFWKQLSFFIPWKWYINVTPRRKRSGRNIAELIKPCPPICPSETLSYLSICWNRQYRTTITVLVRETF